MSTEVRPRSKRTLLRLLVFVGIVATGLAIASAVFAGWTTINLGNSGIDTTWGTATYTDATGDTSPANTRDDIRYAWFKYDGTNIYFHIQTVGSPALSSSNRRAVGKIDCNNSGTFNEGFTPDDTTAGDRLIIYNPGPTNAGVYIRDGALQQITSALPGDNVDVVGGDIEWQVPLSYLPPPCRASPNSINIEWAVADGTTGAVVDGSSQYFPLDNGMDYGDSSNPTPASGSCETPAAGNPQTLLICNGARNGIAPYQTPNEPLRLGAEALDGDAGNLQNANSDADDTLGTTPDDEAGIAPDAASPWQVGLPPNAGGKLLFSVYGGAARLACFIDWNKDGNWDTANEAVLNANVGASTGTSRAFTIPAGVTIANNSFPARCRVYPQPPATGNGTPTPTPAASGAYEFGEVEDHIWSFDANGYYIAPFAPSAVTGLAIATSGTANVMLTWTNPSPNDGTHVLGHATNPYFTSATGPFEVDQLVSAAPWQYSHANILGAPASTVYYIAYGRYGTTEVTTPSNRVGLFEFALTPGLP